MRLQLSGVGDFDSKRGVQEGQRWTLVDFLYYTHVTDGYEC